MYIKRNNVRIKRIVLDLHDVIVDSKKDVIIIIIVIILIVK